MAIGQFVTGDTVEYSVSKGKDKGLVSDIYKYTKDYRDVTQYNLLRGVPDFGNLMQFTPYESGYAVFIICAIPKFMEELGKYNDEYAKLIANWKHIVEFEFKSFDGIDSITADTIDIGDDLNKIQVINKVNMQSTSEFSLSYTEKSGSPLTKFNKLYLTGIKDPRTQIKNYHGLIHRANDIDPGFENEVFTFLFMTTDNTMRYVEFSTLLIGGQLTDAPTDIYGSYSKGDIGSKEITLKFNAYPIVSSAIDSYAQDCLDYLVGDGKGNATDGDGNKIGITVSSMDYEYTASTQAINSLLTNWGGDAKVAAQNHGTSSDSPAIAATYATSNV
jgi:hypothetical protein